MDTRISLIDEENVYLKQKINELKGLIYIKDNNIKGLKCRIIKLENQFQEVTNNGRKGSNNKH